MSASKGERGGVLEIRELEPDEEERFVRLGKAVFGPVTGLGLSVREVNLVAVMRSGNEGDEEPVGGVVATLERGKDGQVVGVVRWLFVTEEARGRGLGRNLVKECIRALREAGASWVFSDVLGENTSSSGVVTGLGGRQFSPREQLRAVGLSGMLRVWKELKHWRNQGFYIYGWGKNDEEDSVDTYRSGELPISAGIVAALATLAALRAGQNVVFVLAIALGLLLLREAVVRTVAGLQGLRLRHAAWESGLPIGVGLALVAGVYFPVVGGLYPQRPEWRSREEAGRRGKAALVFSLLLIGALAAGSLLGGELGAALRFVSIPMLLFGVFFATPPFEAFDASRLREWNPGVWVAVVALTLGVWWWV